MINMTFILSKGAKFLLDQQAFPYKNACAIELRKQWNLPVTSYDFYDTKSSSNKVSQDVFAFSNYPPKFDGTDKVYATVTDWKMDSNSMVPTLSDLGNIWKAEVTRRCHDSGLMNNHCMLQKSTWKNGYVVNDIKGKEWRTLDVEKSRYFPYDWVRSSTNIPVTQVYDNVANPGVGPAVLTTYSSGSPWSYSGTTIPGTSTHCPYMKPYDEDEYYTGRFNGKAESYCCRKVTIWKENGWRSAEALAAVVASGVMILSFIYLFFYLRPRIRALVERDEEYERRKKEKYITIEKGGEDDAKEHDTETPEKKDTRISFMKWLYAKVFPTVHTNIHTTVMEGADEYDREVSQMHEYAEKFDPLTEKLFEYLQVFSACAMSFSHGASDVANSIGPFAGVWYAYKFKMVMAKSPQLDDDMKWILGLGGAGLVIGLATYGHVIMRGMGVKIAKITPSRGFCMETATGVTVIFASAFGLPISTTQCQVGSTMGVGMLENWRRGVNWKYLRRTFAGWVATLIITGTLCAAFYSQGAYAPNVFMVKDRLDTQNMVGNHVFRSLQMIKASYSPTGSMAQTITELDVDNKLLNLYQFKNNGNDAVVLPNVTCRKNLLYNPLKDVTTTDIAKKIGTGRYVPSTCLYTVQSPCLYYDATQPMKIKCKEMWGDSSYSYYQNVQYWTSEDQKDILNRLEDVMAGVMGVTETDYVKHP